VTPPVASDAALLTLLAGCLHQDAGPRSAERLVSLSPAEWERLLGLADERQVTGLLRRRVRALGVEPAAPGAVLETLCRTCREVTAQNLRMYAELRRVVAALHARHVRVIVLKGAYLAAAVYQDLASREMGDVDVMVPAGDLGQAAEIVESLGYAPVRPYAAGASIAAAHDLPRFRAAGAVPLELHWNITDPDSPYGIAADGLWARALPSRLMGMDVLTLCPEDLLLHVAVHASYTHRFDFGLRALCDIAEIVRHFGALLAWSTVTERAREWRWERGVYATLRLAKDTVGAAVPENVIRELCPAGATDPIIGVARAHVMRRGARTTALAMDLATLSQRAGLTNKLRLVWAMIFPPKARISRMYAVPVHSRQIYRYYLARLRVVLPSQTPLAFALLCGDRTVRALAQRKAALREWLARPAAGEEPGQSD
jgi:hypothetical protein